MKFVLGLVWIACIFLFVFIICYIIGGLFDFSLQLLICGVKMRLSIYALKFGFCVRRFQFGAFGKI